MSGCQASSKALSHARGTHHTSSADSNGGWGNYYGNNYGYSGGYDSGYYGSGYNNGEAFLASYERNSIVPTARQSLNENHRGCILVLRDLAL